MHYELYKHDFISVVQNTSQHVEIIYIQARLYSIQSKYIIMHDELYKHDFTPFSQNTS